MTLTDIQNQVVSILFEQDNISITKIVPQLDFSEEFETMEEKISIVKLVMEKLEKINLVAKISEDKYILTTSFESNSQTVEISPETALMLSMFVNTYSEASNITGQEVNILNITDQDIKNACHIGNLLLKILSAKSKDN